MNIFKTYKKRYPNEIIDTDGIVNKSVYRKQPHKALFILKETNDLEGSLVEFLRKGAPEGGWKTWQPACKWMEALLDGSKNSDYKSAEERKAMLNRVATMNLKKVSGGATSDYSYINWGNNNKDLLIAQIKEISPDVIVCCCDNKGNDFIFNELLNISCSYYDKKSDLSYGEWNGKKVIYARHPLLAPVEWRDSFVKFHSKL